jgi:hypothetical protein
MPDHFPRIYRIQNFLIPDAEVVARTHEVIARSKELLRESVANTFLGVERKAADSNRSDAARNSSSRSDWWDFAKS